jgi:hypothetical protein
MRRAANEGLNTSSVKGFYETKMTASSWLVTALLSLRNGTDIFVIFIVLLRR